MSALPPIATAKTDISPGKCPLYPRKQTCAVQLGMSALGQKRTFSGGVKTRPNRGDSNCYFARPSMAKVLNVAYFSPIFLASLTLRRIAQCLKLFETVPNLNDNTRSWRRTF